MARVSIPVLATRVFTALFLLPFVGFGVFAAVSGYRSLVNADMPKGEAIGILAFGAVFALFPMVVFALMVTGAKRKKKAKSRLDAHAERPWLLRPEWVNGRIRSGSRAALIFIWLFSLTFSGFCIPILLNFLSPTGDKGIPAVVFGGLFMLAACGLLYAAIYMTVRWLKYGKSYFELATNPGVVGGWFKGAVHSGLRLGPNDKVHLRLTCAREYTTGSGDNKSRHTDLKWQEENTIPAARVEFGGVGGATRIPTTFYIPRDCRPTTLDDSSDRIVWRLEVTADIPGVDFKATYEVPVFVTPESSDEPPPEAAGLYELTQDQVVDYAATSKIRVRPAQGGGTEIYVPPRRTPRIAAVCTVFAATFSATTVFLMLNGALFMAFVFGLFAALLIWASLGLWFGTRNTVLGADAVNVHYKVIGPGKTRTIPKADIVKVDISIGMQSGDRAYYRVRLHLGGRKTREIATGIRDKNEARWIASIVESYLEAE